MRLEWTVDYQVGTYSGVIAVMADEDSDTEHVVALAKRRLYRDGHPGMCSESFRVTSRSGGR